MNMPAEPMLRDVQLDDKYTADSGQVYLTGTQALVRLPLMQRRRDLAAGLNTGGYISGYRGSPIGAYDQALWRARKHLDDHHVRFVPGLNEDLAATAIWGTQQLHFFRVRSTTACSRSGTARDRVLTEPATRFVTPIRQGVRRMAGCWRLAVMITAQSPQP